MARLPMAPALLVAVYCVLLVGASIFGGVLPSLVRVTHTGMQSVISFVAGFMLGVSLFLMLPHSAAATGSVERTALWMMFGLLAMFFLIRTFHFHEHEPEAHAHDEGHGHRHGHRLSWVGVAVGMALHTTIDGAALAASVVAAAAGETEGALFGIGTFLAILLHKPLDSLSIMSLLAAGGRPPRLRLLVNAGFALMCPLGAGLFWLGVGGEPSAAVGCALAFAAGVFLCISLADLLPELQFHRHDRLRLSATLLAGVLLAWGVGRLESGAHDHGHDHGHEHHDH